MNKGGLRLGLGVKILTPLLIMQNLDGQYELPREQGLHL